MVEKRPKLLVDAAKLADEYAVLYKPFHAEQDNSWKSDDRNYSDKPEKTFHKNGGRGTFHQKYHHKGKNNHKNSGPCNQELGSRSLLHKVWPRRSYSVGMLCKETDCAPPDTNAKHCI